MTPFNDSSTRELLANAPWQTLSGSHASSALCCGNARRYAPGLAPIAAFQNPETPDLGGLARLTAPGEMLHLPGAAAVAHDGWKHVSTRQYTQMVLRPGANLDSAANGWRWLGRADAEAVHALASLCAPGPFSSGMLALGDFIGMERDGMLVSAAGTRLHAGPFREICTVCTHPDHRGHGFASNLVRILSRRILARGETPFLHVESTAFAVLELYRRLGFEPLQQTPLHTIERTEILQ